MKERIKQILSENIAAIKKSGVRPSSWIATPDWRGQKEALIEIIAKELEFALSFFGVTPENFDRVATPLVGYIKSQESNFQAILNKYCYHGGEKKLTQQVNNELELLKTSPSVIKPEGVSIEVNAVLANIRTFVQGVPALISTTSVLVAPEDSAAASPSAASSSSSSIVASSAPGSPSSSSAASSSSSHSASAPAAGRVADQTAAIARFSFSDVIRRLREHDVKLKCIDFESESLNLRQMRELAAAIEDNMHVGSIKWNPLSDASGEIGALKEQIEKKLEDNNRLFEFHPSDYGLALMSNAVYEQLEEAQQAAGGARNLYEQLAREDRERAGAEALSEWQVFRVIDDTHKRSAVSPAFAETPSSYYGAIFVNQRKGQIVLAHRGTEVEFSDLLRRSSSTRTDIKSIVGGAIGAHLARAYQATLLAAEAARDRGYSLTLTGHSLGGFLAELSVYYCKFDQALKDSGVIFKGVVFDSPGSLSMLESFKSRIKSDFTDKDLGNFPLVSYLAIPNPVNICNQKLGAVYCLTGIVPPRGEQQARLVETLLAKAATYAGYADHLKALKSVFSHSLKGIIDQFDPATGKPRVYERVLDWPHLEQRQGSKFSSTGLLQQVIGGAARLIPGFGAVMPSAAAGAANYILNTVVGDITILTIVDVLVDFATGRLNADKFFDLQGYLTDSYGLRADLTVPEQYYVSYKNHYSTEAVNLFEDIRDGRKGVIDWYLNKIKINEERLASISSSPSALSQLTEMASCYELEARGGKEFIRITAAKRSVAASTELITVDRLRTRLARLLEVESGLRKRIELIRIGAVSVVTQVETRIASLAEMMEILRSIKDASAAASPSAFRESSQMLTQEQLTQLIRGIYGNQDKLPKLLDDGDVPERSIGEYFVNLQIILEKKKVDKTESIEEQASESLEKSSEQVELDQAKSRVRMEIEQLTPYEQIRGDSIEKVEIEVGKLFDEIDEGNPAVNSLLILGRAGVGKTTLMHYIAYKWSCGELWNDKFNLVVRVRLRDLTNVSWKDAYERRDLSTSAAECFMHHCITVQLSGFLRQERGLGTISVEDVKACDKSKMLLLVDGYDEVAHLEDITAQKVIKEVMGYENIIMTSRPNAVSHDVELRFKRRVENIGLDSKSIEAYVDAYYKRKDAKAAESLKGFLQQHGQMMSVCSTPINAELICMLWESPENRRKFSEQSDIANLYKNIVIWLCKRYLVKFTGRVFTDISDDEALSIDSFKTLSRLAYYLSTQDGMSLSISGDEIVKNIIRRDARTYESRELEILRELNKLGIIRSEGDGRDLSKERFGFIHLTFQEYFAAIYLHQELSSGEEARVSRARLNIAEAKYQPNSLQMLRFLVGIVSRDTAELIGARAAAAAVGGGASGGDAANIEVAERFWSAITDDMVIDRSTKREVRYTHLTSRSDLMMLGVRLLPITFDIKNCYTPRSFADEVENFVLERLRREDEIGFRRKKMIIQFIQANKYASRRVVEYELGLVSSDESFEEARQALVEIGKVRPETLAQIVPVLIGLLSRLEVQLVTKAAESLVEMAWVRPEIMPQVVPALVGLLLHTNNNIVIFSAISLVKLNRVSSEILPQVVLSLIKSISRRDEDYQKEIVEALVKLGKVRPQILPQILPDLVGLLRHSELRLAKYVAKNLLDLGKVLAEILPQVVQAFLDQLLYGGEYGMVATKALVELEKLNPDMISLILPSLLEMLKHKNPEIVWAAVSTLLELEREGDKTWLEDLLPQIVNAIMGLIEYENSAVVRRSIKMLEELERGRDKIFLEIMSEVFPALTRLPLERDAVVFVEVIKVLKKFGKKRAEILLQVLSTYEGLLLHKSWLVLEEVARSLGDLASSHTEVMPKVIPILLGLLSNGNEYVVVKAVSALVKMERVRVEMGEESIPELVQAFKNENIAQQSVNALVELCKLRAEILPEVTKALLEKLLSTDRYVPLIIAEVVLELERASLDVHVEVTTMLFAALTNLLSHKGRRFKTKALGFLVELGKIHGGKSIDILPAMEGLIADEDTDVVEYAVGALVELGKVRSELSTQVVQKLLGLVLHKDKIIVVSATNGLFQLTTVHSALIPKVLPDMTGLLTHWDFGVPVALVLLKMAKLYPVIWTNVLPKLVPAMIYFLSYRDIDVVKEATEGLLELAAFCLPKLIKDQDTDPNTISIIAKLVLAADYQAAIKKIIVSGRDSYSVVCNGVEIKLSGEARVQQEYVRLLTNALRREASACVVMPARVEYDNLILAHPRGEELIKFTHQHYGMHAVDKILELGKDAEKTRQFWQDIEERSIVRGAINRIIGIDKGRHPLLRFTQEPADLPRSHQADSTSLASVSSTSDHSTIMPVLHSPPTVVAKDHEASTRVLKCKTAKATLLGV